jgi:type IV pilus assembly protein PilO
MAFLDPLVDAPRWQQLVLGVIGLIGLGGVGHLLAISALETRVAELYAQRDAQRQEISRMQALAADLPRVRREATEVERRLEAAKEKLPSEREMPAFYRTLSDAAVQAGLAVTLFQPQGPRVGDFYSEIPIVLIAEGDYHDVGDFVGRVATLSRTTTIGELKLTGASADTGRPGPAPAPALRSGGGESRIHQAATAKKPQHSLRAEITLLTYVYRPVGSPPAPKSAAAPSRSEAPKP